MRVVTLNVNGIRASARKGLMTWLQALAPDIVCVQETRAPHSVLESDPFQLSGYCSDFEIAQKAGYSGVGIYSKLSPLSVTRSLGWPSSDDEGRFIQADFDHFSIASLYLPSGSSGEARQAVKDDFLEKLYPFLVKQRAANKPFILCGDFNIVHREIDIRNFKQNQKSSGCLPHEREWIDRLFTEVGYLDAFREVEPGPDQYTWWSNRGRAWDNNVGWRIDYQITTPHFSGYVRSASVYKEERFSDHAPLIVDYDFDPISGGWG